MWVLDAHRPASAQPVFFQPLISLISLIHPAYLANLN